ncbi:hypothetical protein [Nonomuraea dietziae]
MAAAATAVRQEQRGAGRGRRRVPAVDTLYDLPLTAEMLAGMLPVTDLHR